MCIRFETKRTVKQKSLVHHSFVFRNHLNLTNRVLLIQIRVLNTFNLDHRFVRYCLAEQTQCFLVPVLFECVCVCVTSMILSLKKTYSALHVGVPQVRRSHQLSAYPVRGTRCLAHHLRKELTKLSNFHCRDIDCVLREMSDLLLRSVFDTGYEDWSLCV